MKNEDHAQSIDDLGHSFEWIDATAPTDGRSFGLVPIEEGPIVDVGYKSLYYGHQRNGVSPDPNVANTALYKSKFQYSLSTIETVNAGLYRIDWFCTLQLNVAEDEPDSLSSSGSLEPTTHVTTEIVTFRRPSPDLKPLQTVVAASYNTFKPMSLLDHPMSMSRTVRLEDKTEVCVRFIVNQRGASVRLWQHERTDYQDTGSTVHLSGCAPAQQTGFYLTQM